MNRNCKNKFGGTAYILIMLIIMLLGKGVFAQLNCKTTSQKDGTRTMCFHENLSLSTLETWDNDNKWGSITAYDSNRNELFSYTLRRFAGHASASLTYYPNGQVKKVVFRSAPDGGIQFTEIIQEFNENGMQTSYVDLSQPDGFPVLHIPTKNPKTSPEERKVVSPEVAKCAVPYTTVFTISNETRKRVVVRLTPMPSHWATLRTHCSVNVKPKTTVAIDSVYLAERFLEINETYNIEVVSPRKMKRAKIITSIPKQTKTRREYVWYLVD